MKIDDPISLPIVFQEEGHYYILKGFIVHISFEKKADLRRDSTGHYIAYVEDDQGQWYEVDDHRVRALSKEHIQEISQQAYIALYVKANGADL